MAASSESMSESTSHFLEPSKLKYLESKAVVSCCCSLIDVRSILVTFGVEELGPADNRHPLIVGGKGLGGGQLQSELEPSSDPSHKRMYRGGLSGVVAVEMDSKTGGVALWREASRKLLVELVVVWKFVFMIGDGVVLLVSRSLQAEKRRVEVDWLVKPTVTTSLKVTLRREGLIPNRVVGASRAPVCTNDSRMC